MNAQRPHMSDEVTDRLVALLEEQRDLYLSLQTLSRRQRSLITGDEPEALLSLLQDREKLVRGLARVNQQIGPYRKQWDAIYAALPEGPRTQVSSLLRQVDELLHGIIRTDKEDTEMLAVRKQAVAQQSRVLNDGHAAQRAYAQVAQGPTGPSKRDQHG